MSGRNRSRGRRRDRRGNGVLPASKTRTCAPSRRGADATYEAPSGNTGSGKCSRLAERSRTRKPEFPNRCPSFTGGRFRPLDDNQYTWRPSWEPALLPHPPAETPPSRSASGPPAGVPPPPIGPNPGARRDRLRPERLRTPPVDRSESRASQAVPYRPLAHPQQTGHLAVVLPFSLKTLLVTIPSLRRCFGIGGPRPRVLILHGEPRIIPTRIMVGERCRPAEGRR